MRAVAAGGVRLAENHRHADAAFFLSLQDAPGRFLLVCLQLPGSGLLTGGGNDYEADAGLVPGFNWPSATNKRNICPKVPEFYCTVRLPPSESSLEVWRVETDESSVKFCTFPTD